MGAVAEEALSKSYLHSFLLLLALVGRCCYGCYAVRFLVSSAPSYCWSFAFLRQQVAANLAIGHHTLIDAS